MRLLLTLKLTALLTFSGQLCAQTWTPGTNALRFDGVNDYVTFGQAPGLGASRFTLECWFRREGAGATTTTGSGGATAVPLVTKGRSENDGPLTNCNYFFGIDINNILAADFEEATNSTSPGANHPVRGVTLIASNTWYHGAVTYNGTNWSLYLNGALETNLNVNRLPESNSIQHAALATALNTSGTPSGYFKGVLDEVRIWNYARTAAQISNNLYVEITSAPGLIGRWGLNEAGGATAFDSSGSGINGTLVNGPTWIPILVTNVTRGPYLQLATPTSIIVRWRTDVPTDSRVKFGVSPTNLTSFVDNATSTTEHEVQISGLSADTRYYYSVGAIAAVLVGGDTNHFFVTAPLPGTPRPTRIWAIGDFGFGSTNQMKVRDAYYNFAGTNQTDVWLMLGDNAYNSGLDSEYQTGVFDVYPQLFRHAVVWPALGNHDTAQSHVSNDTYAYFDIFTLPKSGEAGGEASGSEHFYSFDYGNIHFVCLDSMTDLLRATNSAMANWLRGDLANNTNTWLIAYFHHPPYTKGSHDSDDVTNDYELVEMRENFLPILESYGVDLVLSGHSHVYERSYFIDRHYGYSDSFDTSTNIVQPGSGRVGGTGAYTKATGLPVHKGAVYVVCGSSGATGGGTLDHPAMYVSLNNLGSMVIDVSSNRLDATFLRESGIVPATNDWFTIIKQPPAPPVASNLTFNLPADSATNLFLVGSDPGGRPLTFATNSVATRGLVTGFTASNGAFTYTPAHGFVGGDGFTFLVNNGITNSPTATVTLNVLALAEANSNGIPDVWESLYGVTNASADPDGDGLSNLQEYLANTNPTNAASALLAPTVTRTTNGFAVLTWPSIGGCRYRVKFSNGDATGNYNGAFTDVARPIDKEMDPAPIGTPTTQSWTDNFTFTGGAPATGRRYYRIEVVR